jgi:hypothetical protein
MPSLDEVHWKFGYASEAAQLLETQLGNILLEIHASEEGLFSGDRRELATEILKRINRSTLGHLLTKLKAKTDKFENAADLFARALADRNRLAHSFYRVHNLRRNSDSGRAVMLADLEAIHATILDAYKLALAVTGFALSSVVDYTPDTRHLKI